MKWQITGIGGLHAGVLLANGNVGAFSIGPVLREIMPRIKDDIDTLHVLVDGRMALTLVRG